MERPFDRKPTSEASRNRYAQSSSAMPDPFEVANREFGGTPRPFARERITKKPPEQSGEFRKAKNQPREEEIVEISSDELEEVPSEEAAEAALEMGDSDTIPTREVMPWASTIPNEKSRQQKRAEARQFEKRTSRSEKTSKSIFDAEDASSQNSKKTKGFYAPGSLDRIMARIDAVEEELLSLQDGHANLASNTRASEEELRRELEFLRAGLGIEKKAVPSPTSNKELPDLNLESDGTLSARTEDEPEMSWGEAMIDNPDAPPVAKKARTKRATTELAESDIIDVTTKTSTDKAREAMRIELTRLGEETGIITDPVARQQKAIATASEVRERDAELKTMQATLRSYENHLRDAEDKQDKADLRKQIKTVKQRMEKQTNERDALVEEYDYLMDHPTLEDELQEKLIALSDERERVKNPIRLRKIEKDIALLERMGVLARDARTWMNPEEAKNVGWAFGKPASKESRGDGAQSGRRDLGIDYSYPTKPAEVMEDNPDTEITLDEADLPATYNDNEEDVGPLPDSEVEKLQQEYAKYRAPKEERTPSPRVAAGGTLEEKIAAIEQMVKTKRTPSGRWLSVDEVLKFERAANALKKQRPKKGEYLDAQTTERSSNTREIIPPPLPPRKKQMRERIDIDEGIIERYEAQQKKASEQKQKNIATYEARANTYKTELRGIAEKLATYGEQVEIPGEETKRLKNTPRSWLKSLWKKVIDGSEITELKKRYETTLERYEEAQQQKNAVERNIPVYERATLTRGPQGFAEEPGRIEERRAEQIEFETELRHLAFTERSAQNLMDSLVLNQRIDGSMLDKKEKLQATDRIEQALLKQQAGSEEYKSITQKRFNAIPIMQLNKLATAKEFSRSFEFDEEILKGVESIQNDTERTLKSLEAKVSLGLGTKDEREASRRRLNELKRLLGGKSAEEAAQRASFLVRAAERIALMKIEDRVLHQDLAIKYGRRIKELKALLAPRGMSAELLTDLEKELRNVAK